MGRGYDDVTGGTQMAEATPAGGKRTNNAVPFSSQLDPALHEEFKARVGLERRTVRAVLEQALRHYMETGPANGNTSTPKKKGKAK